MPAAAERATSPVFARIELTAALGKDESRPRRPRRWRDTCSRSENGKQRQVVASSGGDAEAQPTACATDELEQRRATDGASLVGRLRNGSVTRRAADEADALRLHFRNANQDAVVPAGGAVALADRRCASGRPRSSSDGGCTKRTHGRSAAGKNGAFGPNFRIGQEEKLCIRRTVLAKLVQTRSQVGLLL